MSKYDNLLKEIATYRHAFIATGNDKSNIADLLLKCYTAIEELQEVVSALSEEGRMELVAREYIARAEILAYLYVVYENLKRQHQDVDPNDAEQQLINSTEVAMVFRIMKDVKSMDYFKIAQCREVEDE